TVAGTYQWDATYSSDSNNNSTSEINATTEQVVVSPPSPTIITTPNQIGRTSCRARAPVLKASATLTGDFNRTDSINFALCFSRALKDTETVTDNGNGTYTTRTDFTLPTTRTVAGTYQWDATYTSDNSNNNSTSEINATTEQVVVSPASPTIFTTPN